LPFAHEQLVTTLHLKGMQVEAVAALRQAAMARGDRELEQVISRAYAQEGYDAVWRRAADTLAARLGSAPMGVQRVANYYMRAGDQDLALDWLQKAYDARDPNIYGIISPAWDAARQHPRFQALWTRIRGPV
jgi:tetratricopeptide (TPR) repeat protein